jgi:hypothetical protein
VLDFDSEGEGNQVMLDPGTRDTLAQQGARW